MSGKHGRHLYETAFDAKSCRRSSESSHLDIINNYVLEGRPLHLPCNAVFRNECSPKRLQNTARKKLETSSEYRSSGGSISQRGAEQLDANRSTLLHGYSSATSTSIYPRPAESAIPSNMNDILDTFSEASRCRPHNVYARFDKRINNFNYINNEEKRSKIINNLNEASRNRRCGPVDNCPSDRPGCGRRSSTNKILEIKGRPKERRANFSSTESITTSSSAGSLESIKSTISISTSGSSTESNRSSSLSSHSSDSAVGNSVFQFAFNYYQANNRVSNRNKMHVLSPISDKSFQETGSESCDVHVQRSDSPSPRPDFLLQPAVSKNNKKRTSVQNKTNSLSISLTGGDLEAQQCSDSGISVESKSEMVKQTQTFQLDALPFDMPKLRRRRLQQIQLPGGPVPDTSTDVTSVDIKDLPFDMPKLRRKMKALSMEGSGVELRFDSQDSRQSGNDEAKCESNFDSVNNRRSLGLNLNLNEIVSVGSRVDTDLPLERQGWYHGAISRLEAENELRCREEGSYLVRNNELVKNDYSLSLKGAKGFMHIRIQKQADSTKFILGQLSSPFDSIPQMINHYSRNQLPIRGAEHMCLLKPVIVQLL